MEFEPSYLKLYESGELVGRIENLYKILESCELCPRRCRVNRLEGKKGRRKSGEKLVVSSYFIGDQRLHIYAVSKNESREAEHRVHLVKVISLGK